MDLRVEFLNLPPFVARLRGAKAIIRAELATGMHRIVIVGQNFVRAGARVDTGRSRNSVTSRVELGGDVRGIWGTNVDYAVVVMEEGRAAGSAMPPQGALLGWMARHGIDPSAEFVVRRAIGRHGIKALHLFRNSLEKVGPVVQREMSAAIGRALARIGGGR